MHRGPSHSRPIEVEFRGQLPYRLSAVLTLLADASRFEGFAQPVYVLYAALSPELRRDIDLIFGPLGKPLIFRALWEDSPQIDEFSAFIGWLSKLDLETVRGFVRRHLEARSRSAHLKEGKTLAVPEVEDTEALRDFLLQSESRWSEAARADATVLDPIVRFLQDPAELLARLVFLMTQFWDAHYKEIYAECTPIIERSLRYHRSRRYGGEFPAIYAAVTGKRLTEDVRQKVYEVRRIVFVPNCHSGPYVSFVPLKSGGETMLLAFNCRPSSGAEEEQSEIIRDIFPPLRALADETRLEIVYLLQRHELYAQQIVDHLDLSQSSVSRHLNLLVAGNVLSVRKKSGMKFYRINEATMQQLAAQLYGLSEERGEPVS